jgi:hypothetical protein
VKKWHDSWQRYGNEIEKKCQGSRPPCGRPTPGHEELPPLKALLALVLVVLIVLALVVVLVLFTRRRRGTKSGGE